MMTAQPRWQDPTGPLKTLGAALGFDPVKLDYNEWPDHISWSDPRLPIASLALQGDPTMRAQELDAVHKAFEDLKEKYGPALTLRLKLHPKSLNLNGQYQRSMLDEFCDEVGDSPTIDFYIKIDKRKLAPFWGFNHNAAAFKLFLFHTALNRALSVSLIELEAGDKALLKEFTGGQKLIILVPDHTIALNGDYLAVLGGDNIANWEDYLPAAKPTDARDKISFVHTYAMENLKWVSIYLERLTPLQLCVDWTLPKDGLGSAPANDDEIARALYAQLVACSLLHLAARSHGRPAAESSQGEIVAQVAGNRGEAIGSTDEQTDNLLVATFAADKYLARIEIGDTAKIGETLIAADGDVPWQSAKTIGDLVKWVYKEKAGVANRLSVLQAVIARSLQDNKASENLQELLRRAPELFDRIQRRWDAFMDEKLHRYFTQIKELEETVKITTKTYNDQVQALTKALTDNMLAAVAVVVGSLIAAIFKAPFQTYIFWVGTGIYVAYLVVFPVVIGLLSTWQRFTDSRAAFAKTEQAFENLLSPTEVQGIVGETVSKSERRFRKWFWTTLTAYAAVVVLLIVASVMLPSQIRKWADHFEVTGIEYSEPASSDVVHVKIQGENFDNTREITVKVGDSEFSNATGAALKVHGSTVLTLSPKQEDLLAAKQKGEQYVVVRQGSAQPKELPLPISPAPIPKPIFEKWEMRGTRKRQVVEAQGTNFGSIADIALEGSKQKIRILDEGRRLELGETGSLRAAWADKSLDLTLKNGERIHAKVSF